MFKPGDWILYHMPYSELPQEKRLHGPAARPFLVVQAWPNEYGPGKHGYNGILFLDGRNDEKRELNIVGKTCVERYDRLPFAQVYSVPQGDEEGMVSATPNHAEETCALPPMVNISGWGTHIPGEPRTGTNPVKYMTITNQSGPVTTTATGLPELTESERQRLIREGTQR